MTYERMYCAPWQVKGILTYKVPAQKARIQLIQSPIDDRAFVMHLTIWLHTRLLFMGSLYLYTTELGTTPPPELSTSRLLYIRFRQNRLKYYMIKRTKVHHWLCRKMVLHGKQEYCTSQNKGILYITEIRNIVHHRKQEYCTSLKSGILYITEKKEFCTTQKTGILYNTEIRNIVHHWYDKECKLALCCCTKIWCMSA